MARHQKLKSRGSTKVSNVEFGLLLIFSPILIAAWIGCSLFGSEALIPSAFVGFMVIGIIADIKGD